MRRDPQVWLYDVVAAGRAIGSFLEGKTIDDYLASELLRAAVERKLALIGEAVSQIRANSPSVAGGLPNVGDIVGFRNLLVHGYYKLDDKRVFDIATASVPGLLTAAASLLERPNEHDG